MNKLFRFAVSAVLIFCTICGILLLPVSAKSNLKIKTNSKINYVAIGDSISQGYMFTDYKEDSPDHVCGFEGCSDRSYIHLFYNEILGGSSKANLYDLTLQGLRFNEIYYLLDPQNAPKDEFCDTHFGWYLPNSKLQTLGDLSDYYISSVKNADIITLDIGMNHFGTYLFDRIAGNYQNDSFSDFHDMIDPQTEALVSSLSKKVYSLLSGMGLDNLNDIVECVLYTYTSFIVYCNKTIELIYKLNPDVELIVFGMFNPMPGLSGDLGSIKLPFSGVLDLLFGNMNSYFTTQNKYCSRYKYADLHKGVEIFADEYLRGYDEISLDQKILVAQKFNELLGEDVFASILFEDLDYSKAVLVKAVYGDTFSGDDIRAAYTNTSRRELASAYLRNAFDNVLKAIEAAMTLRSIPIGVVGSAFGEPDTEELRAVLSDYTTASKDSLAKLHMIILIDSHARGYGGHPSPTGMEEMYDALIKAYKSPLSANGVILNRILFTITDATETISSFFRGDETKNISPLKRFINSVSSIFGQA